MAGEVDQWGELKVGGGTVSDSNEIEKQSASVRVRACVCDKPTTTREVL